MNKAITFEVREGCQHTVKLFDAQSGEEFIRGWQKIGKRFILRTIGMKEIIAGEEIPNMKLSELKGMERPIRVMFSRGSIETFDKIEGVKGTGLVCCIPAATEEEPIPKPKFIKGKVRVSVIFD